MNDTDVMTERLRLSVPRSTDLDELHEIYSDPAVWTHFPSQRHVDVETTREMLRGWVDGLQDDGLSSWVVRRADDPAVIGHGGCSLRRGAFWNLGYCFAAASHGHGFATEVARAGVLAARAHRPEVPVVAYLLEHNVASRRVAEKVGLTEVHRAPDAGNPDPAAIRLVFADRPLSPDVLTAALA